MKQKKKKKRRMAVVQAIPVGDAAFQNKLAYLDKLIDDPDLVVADIYVITDSQTNKRYVGQSVSHRMNRGRYRPYGYVKRFDSHVSQANNNSPSKPVYELQAAMRDHMAAFSVKLIMRCPKEQADDWEKHFVAHFNSCWPNGYNQTTGGKGNTVKVFEDPNRIAPPLAEEHIKRKPTDAHKDDTKAKIADGIRRHYAENANAAKELAGRTRNQHLEKKFEIGMPFKVDVLNLEGYLSPSARNITVRFERKRDGKVVTFHIGKDETVEDAKKRAMDFLVELARRQTAQEAEA